MRLVYLCTVDPPPPNSDWPAVQSFFQALPEFLQPRDNKNNSPHMCFFADRIGSNWLPEFHDFAIVFLSERFLNDDKALQCLGRAKTAFPNMVCIDLHNNLSKEQLDTASKYAKRIFSPDEGKEFLITTFPEIAAVYDLEEKELTKSIETDGYEYLNCTINDLKKQEKQHRIVSWVCYALSLIFLLAMLLFAYMRFSDLTNNEGLAITISQTIILCVEVVILSILAVSVSRFLFLLGKSFMVEGIRCADRAHAIGLGRLYLQLYKGKFKWAELKDVLKNWNIDQGSAFINLDAKDIEPVSLDKLTSIFKNG